MPASVRSQQAPTWLIAAPIAHRGLHGRENGVIENSAQAAQAAIAHGFAIECDVQLTQDGDAAVFHDFDLGRLTGETGLLRDRSLAQLRSLPYATGPDTIMGLSDLLALIDGRVPLICEIKSRFDGDMRLADRTAAIVAGYRHPVALKSFDPQVIAHLRAAAPCPLGIVAEAAYDHPEWAMLSTATKRDLAQVLHFDATRPDFLSYNAADLPHAVPFLCRSRLGLPVVTWTVRSSVQQAAVAPWADQIVFEGFVPAKSASA